MLPSGGGASLAPPPPQCRHSRTSVVLCLSSLEALEASTAAASWGFALQASQSGWAACVSRSQTCVAIISFELHVS